jgi:hypothetical protein
MNNGEDCPRCLGWTFDDRPCQSMLCQGIAEGRRVEREAIVAWLRRMLWRSSSDHINALSKSIGDEVAAALERGEHEKGEGK